MRHADTAGKLLPVKGVDSDQSGYSPCDVVAVMRQERRTWVYRVRDKDLEVQDFTLRQR
jgi:hypothetical protein